MQSTAMKTISDGVDFIRAGGEMKKLFLSGIAALLLATGTAHAAEWRMFMPPAEYDEPYIGELTIKRVATEQDLRSACPGARWDPHSSGSLGCTMRSVDGKQCTIVVLSDQALKALESPYAAAVIRHEIAHCNGWVGHGGGKLTPMSEMTMPKLPPSTKFLSE
jgi:hypothetical protein